MTLPNFLIIGAQKAGTTSLYRYLEQHPEIYMSPNKEPRFFALPRELGSHGDSRRRLRVFKFQTLEAYETLFEGVTDEKAIGEGSTLYLYDREAPDRILETLPDVKLIAVLRQPAERAYSHFLHVRREGYEPIADFRQALEEEDHRVEQLAFDPLFHYRRRSLYFEQLRRYYERFPADRIKIFLHEDLKRDAGAVVRETFRFLGVSDRRPDVSTRHNVSGVPKSRRVHDFLRGDHALRAAGRSLLPRGARGRIRQAIWRWNLERVPPMGTELHRELTASYRDDVLQLQELIGRDLSHWLEPPAETR